MLKHYDFIIAGGGAAGLSLAHHLAHSPLRDRSILIVDKGAKDRNDRTWAFWTDGRGPYDQIVYRSWSQLRFAGEAFEKTWDLQGYRYKVIRSLDFYRYMRAELSALPNVEFLQGTVKGIEDGVEETHVRLEGETFSAGWVFDSLFRLSSLAPQPYPYHYLKLHFKGWEIETPDPSFDPKIPILMDFRTPQKQDTRFFYVLPYSQRRALVEYTLFTNERIHQADCQKALDDYLCATLGIHDYRILSQEGGILPVTDQPFPRRVGRRVITIGTKGGRVKPTTGYAFQRIQRDSAAIVRSLVHYGHPFAVPEDSRRYRLYDAILLDLMLFQGEQIKPIFTDLFKHNPVERVFGFLDEAAPFHENLQLIATLPPRPFLQALFRMKFKNLIHLRRSTPWYPVQLP